MEVATIDQAIATFTLFLLLTTSNYKLGMGNAEHSSSSGCRESERLALLDLKRRLVDPSGSLSSWRGRRCCSWRGVRCSNGTGRVTSLRLRKLGLGGQIANNPSLLELTRLSYLDVSSNSFNGSAIPEFFGSLGRLTYLNLSNSAFGGTVPHQLGNLTRLRVLDVRSVKAPNVPPAADDLRWLSRLSSLRYLDLSAINLADADVFPAISNLSSLSVLRLSSCRIHRIPSSLPRVDLSSLSTVDLRANNMGYTDIPNWFFDVTGLVDVDFSLNWFHGPISGFRNMSSLRVLKLRDNRFNGSIPFIGNLCGLRTLDLSNNRFGGNLSELAEGWTHCNIGRLPSLEYLLLPNNRLEGPLPELFGQFSELVMLDLSFNSFSGVVSENHFTGMTRLRTLLLSSNSLVINISSDWLPPFQLRTIDVDSNVVGPRFPKWLENQRTLSTVNLSNGSISDAVPEWFWGLSSRVEYLNLSHNQMRGSIPESITFRNVSTIDLRYNQFHGPLPSIGEGVHSLYASGNLFSGDLLPVLNRTTNLSLITVVLSENLISGTVPPSVCGMARLFALDLSSNLLSGEVPRCSTVPEKLSIINLSNNGFSGDIPRWLGSLSYLHSLHLNNNSFRGEMPSFENCSYLYFLDLGNNRLGGGIPARIGERSSFLKILQLRSNLLDGGIPHQLSLLSSLQILDLADNRLSGALPPWLGNLTSMATDELRKYRYNHLPSLWAVLRDYDYTSHLAAQEESLTVRIKGKDVMYDKILFLVVSIDVSENYFSGQIPEELMNLSDLQNLNLSGNRLTGRIPEGIGNLRQLESLDLSRNQLSGEIPSSISLLAYVSYLNLSCNKLSGKVPTGDQLQTLLDPSIYVANDDLCGGPLPKLCKDEELHRATRLPASTEKPETVLWFYFGGLTGFTVGFWGYLLLLEDFSFLVVGNKKFLGFLTSSCSEQEKI